jgi:hypothetical protein
MKRGFLFDRHFHRNVAPQRGMKNSLEKGRTLQHGQDATWHGRPARALEMRDYSEFRDWLTISKGWLRSADILVCELGRLSSRPDAGLESPANRQAGKPAPHCLAVIAGVQLRNSGLLERSVTAGLRDKV